MNFLSFLVTSVLFISTLTSLPVKAESPTDTNSTLPVSKAVSLKSLAKYKTISVTVKDNEKDTKYSGVPLRILFAEMMPTRNIDSMAAWKALAKEELVMEVKGEDGFPALIAATELATNVTGDRFVLATECDGKPMDKGLKLICKNDEHHVRWVHEVINLRVIAVPKN